MRTTTLSLVLALGVACGSTPRRLDVPSAATEPTGQRVAYLKIVAADDEPVGFVDRRLRVDEEGRRVDVDYVKQWEDFAVRGYIYGKGRAVKHVIVPPGLREAKGTAAYDEELPASDRDLQIRRILDLPLAKAPFTLVPASEEDIRRTKPPEVGDAGS